MSFLDEVVSSFILKVAGDQQDSCQRLIDDWNMYVSGLAGQIFAKLEEAHQRRMDPNQDQLDETTIDSLHAEQEKVLEALEPLTGQFFTANEALDYLDHEADLDHVSLSARVPPSFQSSAKEIDDKFRRVPEVVGELANRFEGSGERVSFGPLKTLFNSILSSIEALLDQAREQPDEEDRLDSIRREVQSVLPASVVLPDVLLVEGPTQETEDEIKALLESNEKIAVNWLRERLKGLNPTVISCFEQRTGLSLDLLRGNDRA